MERLLNQKQVAEGFSIPERTLEAWRYRGTGPKYLHVGRHVRYRPQDIEAWLAEQGEQTPARTASA